MDDFLAEVLAQVGDRYQRGVENRKTDANPDAWDGSELVEWGAGRAGGVVNDGAANQYQQMVRSGGHVPVADALKTPGAILYEFTGDPMGSPTRASTAISLGDGKHIIDIDPVRGVRIVEAKDFTFTHAGVMPGFDDAAHPGPMAHAVVEDALARAGLEPGPELQVVTGPGTDPDPDPTPVPTPAGGEDGNPPGDWTDPPDWPEGHEVPLAPAPDTPEITTLAARAAELRQRHLDRASSAERIDLVDATNEQGRNHQLAQEGLKKATFQVTNNLQQAAELRALADESDRRAATATAEGRSRDAEEARESAASQRATAKTAEALAERAKADQARFQADETKYRDLKAEADRRYDEWEAQRDAAEGSLDGLEDRVRHLREAEAHKQRAASHDEEARWFTEHGDPQEAANRAAMGAHERQAAAAARDEAVRTPVDEAPLRATGIVPVGEPVAPPLDAAVATDPDGLLVAEASVLDDPTGVLADEGGDTPTSDPLAMADDARPDRSEVWAGDADPFSMPEPVATAAADPLSADDDVGAFPAEVGSDLGPVLDPGTAPGDDGPGFEPIEG